MKIRFIQNFSTERASFQAGKDYDVTPDTEALRLIKAGVAHKSVEPLEPEKPNPKQNPHLKPGEQAGETADMSKPSAAIAPRDTQRRNANNPAAMAHGKTGAVTPHSGATTTNPSTETSPPSDGNSPLATNVGPEATEPK